MTRFAKTKSALALSVAGLSLATAVQACAQDDDRFAKVEIKPQELSPGVAVLFGAGGNIGVSYGEDGTILIDDQFAPLTEKIQTAVETLGAQPVKFLINTHWHGDHTGGNENLGNAGAVIMAHDNVRVRMAKPSQRRGQTFPAKPKAALPVVTYAEGLKLHLNGEEVRVIGLKPAHTDGDSIIHWTKSNIIHMGDTFFFKMSFPFVDLSSGGDVRGVVAAADKALAIADDETKIIPGHGKMASKADLQAYHDMLAEIIGKVEGAMVQDKTLDQIKAMKPADGYGVKADGFISADAFVETVYKSLGGE
ncbi:MAG: MBL fold metallo-hydrolase [Sphingorhabdus sp.]